MGCPLHWLVEGERLAIGSRWDWHTGWETLGSDFDSEFRVQGVIRDPHRGKGGGSSGGWRRELSCHVADSSLEQPHGLLAQTRMAF